MKLIKPSYTILGQKPGLEGIYEAIERAGRLCYKSERPEGKTAKDFVDMLIKKKHYAMLEHGTVYLKLSLADEQERLWNKYFSDNPYSKITTKDNYGYISTNLRVIEESRIGLKGEDSRVSKTIYDCLCEPTEFHEKRVTVHFTTSIGIGRELIRHRKFSFANESTRYCNYSKDKFNNEIIFIEPYWYKSENVEKCNKMVSGENWLSVEIPNEIMRSDIFYSTMETAEFNYLTLIETGCKPQEAREVLPLATKSELIMTGFISDWKDLFNKRSSIAATGLPHPDMVKLIDPLMSEFTERNYLK